MALPTPFRRLMVASGFSNLADGALQAWMPLIAVGITREPGAVAVVALAQRLPWLVFALPAGALSDRLDRRRTMLGASVARAVVLAGLAVAVATGHETIALLAVVGFALGIAETLFDTSAQSLVPALVPHDHLSQANGRLYAVELGANQFVGPPLGGLVVAVSAAAAVATSAAAYVVAAVALALVAGSHRVARAGPPTSMRADIAEGLRYLWRHRLLRTLALLVGLGNLASAATAAVLALRLVDPGPVGLSEVGYGLVIAAGALGSLVVGPFVARIEAALGRARVLVLALALWGVATTVPAATVSPVAIAASFVVLGGLVVVWNVITVSLRPRLVPAPRLGRLNASYRLVAWGSAPLGAALGGVVATVWSVEAVFWAAGAVFVVALPICRAVVTDAAIAAAEQRQPTAGGGGSKVL
ncbi:MAG: MFS transporter [Acidimicrobiales bacterium]